MSIFACSQPPRGICMALKNTTDADIQAGVFYTVKRWFSKERLQLVQDTGRSVQGYHRQELCSLPQRLHVVQGCWSWSNCKYCRRFSSDRYKSIFKDDNESAVEDPIVGFSVKIDEKSAVDGLSEVFILSPTTGCLCIFTLESLYSNHVRSGLNSKW